MKTKYIAILASLAACGLGMAQTAYTTPVGYNTRSLTAGFNALGLTLQTPTLSAGAFTAVSGTLLTNSGAAFAPIPGSLYVLEITSGLLVGTIQEVPAALITATTFTTPDNLQASGLAVGATYKLRIAPTLEQIFSTVPLASGGVLTAALSAGTADIVWVPNGLGAYTRYFLRSGATPAFRNVATNLASPNVPLVYADGFLVEKKGAAVAALTVSGEVKTVGTNSAAVPGFNLISSVAPVGLNLFNAGLELSLGAALSAGTADVVWVQQPNLSYIQYFRRSGAGAGWRVAGTATTLTQLQAESISLSQGFFVERKGGTPINVLLKVPVFYSGL